MASRISESAAASLQLVGHETRQLLLRIGGGEFDQQVPRRVLRQGVGDAGDMRDGQFDRESRHQFEGGDLVAGRRAQARQ